MPEPEAPLAAVTTHCRGQIAELAREHCDRVTDMGPGTTTSNGVAFGPAGGAGKDGNPLARLSHDQLLTCVQDQLSVLDCVQGAHRRLQDPRLPASVKSAGQNNSTARRRTQDSKGPPPPPAALPPALYEDDGKIKLCSTNQCEPNPCRNGGICIPNGTLATSDGTAAGFVCACTGGMSGLTCDVCEGNGCTAASAVSDCRSNEDISALTQLTEGCTFVTLIADTPEIGCVEVNDRMQLGIYGSTATPTGLQAQFYVTGADALLWLSNVRVQGRQNTGDCGGGRIDGGAIFLHDCSSVVILACEFIGNEAGDGIQTNGYGPLGYGGAITAWGGTVVVRDSTFRDNLAHDHTGSIYINGRIHLSGSTFSGSISRAGGGEHPSPANTAFSIYNGGHYSDNEATGLDVKDAGGPLQCGGGNDWAENEGDFPLLVQGLGSDPRCTQLDCGSHGSCVGGVCVCEPPVLIRGPRPAVSNDNPDGSARGYLYTGDRCQEITFEMCCSECAAVVPTLGAWGYDTGSYCANNQHCPTCDYCGSGGGGSCPLCDHSC